MNHTALAWAIADAKHHRHVAGIVYLDDKPVSATVTLSSFASRSGIIDTPTVTSAADGTFDFGEVAVAHMALVARSGTLTRELELDLNTYADPTHIAVHIYPCQASVGHVVDAGGGPIVGATIYSNMAQAKIATSDANGVFHTCEQLGALTVKAEGYANEFTGLLARNPMVIVMRPETTITGIVVDTGEHPIAGAEVFENANNVAFSDADGHFELRGLAPGAHQLQTRRDDLTACEKAHVDTVVGKSSDVKIVIAPGVTLSGYVHRGPTPASNIEIVWANSKSSLLQLRTKADGTFSDARACPGQGQLWAPLANVALPKNSTYTLTATSSPVDLELESAIEVTVRVVSGGQPVADAAVAAACKKAAPTDQAALTNSAGTTVLTLPPDRQCSIIAWQVFDGRRAETAELSTAELPREYVIDLGKPSNSTITATVSNKNGAALSSLNVQLINQAEVVVGGGESDINGIAIIRHVPPGTYHFKLAPTSFLSRKGPPSVVTPTAVTITSETLDVAITVVADLATTTLTGMIVDAKGAPVADAHVLVYPISDELFDKAATKTFSDIMDTLGEVAGTVAATDDTGHFTMTMTEAPPFTVNASAPQGKGTARVHVVTGDLRVVLSPTPK